MEYRICSVGDLADGDRIIVEIRGREIAVFNVGGEYFAFLNWCPHQGGPLCEGPLSGTTEASFDRESLELERRWARDGTVLVCPWHNWEYDITTGKRLSDGAIELLSYDVEVRNGDILVTG